jgi:hypothetical protein
MVAIEEADDGRVVLKGVGEVANRFFVHRAAQLGEFREMAFALLVERVELVDMQPLAREFPGHAFDTRVLHHPFRLRAEHFRLPQVSGRGHGA